MSALAAPAQVTVPHAPWFTEDGLGMFVQEHSKYFEHLEADLYDPREWATAAKNAGMKYVALTTKHHDGCALWDSALTEYKSTNTPCGQASNEGPDAAKYREYLHGQVRELLTNYGQIDPRAHQSLAGKVLYAPLLNDASEVHMMVLDPGQAGGRMTPAGQAPGTLTMKLPVQRPGVGVPVIELFLTIESDLP
ncbi:alpha-L-fucosidase [Arthrobacter sp. LAPM80]|uniref:alpha-L-fucosidase n=1 Tax=Arthrobacter sp. LAPM80 TaxID=3141788 RepID=UPI00398B8421